MSVIAAIVGLAAAPSFGVGSARAHPTTVTRLASLSGMTGRQIARRNALAAELAARSGGAASAVLAAAQVSVFGLFGPVPPALVPLASDCANDEADDSGSSGVSHLRQAVSAAGSTEPVFDELVPAGDLDRTSGPDVVDFRLAETGFSFDAGITARSGVTGTALWSKSMKGSASTFSLAYPYATLVGPSQTPGVVTVAISEPKKLTNGQATETVRVQAISGSGATVWSKTLIGTVGGTAKKTTITNLPIIVGALPNATGGSDLLITSLNATQTPSTQKGSVQPELMSTTNGSITSLGAPVASSSGVPSVVPLPDLNGDGVDDIAIVSGGSSGRIIAEQGDTGAIIWTSSGVPVTSGALVDPVGFLSDSATQDLLVAGPLGSSSKVSLVDGATGKLIWAHRAICGFEMDEAGKPLQPAVGLLTHEASTSGSKSSTTAITLQPRTAKGTVVYTAKLSVKATSKKRASSAGNALNVAPFGDIQPDGSQDLLVDLSARVGKTAVHKHGIISGRTGHLIREPQGYPAAGSLHDGAATDLLSLVKTSKGLDIAGYDAATGTRYYQRPIAHTRGLRPDLSYGVLISGHHCSDVAVSGLSKGAQLTGLFAGNGKPLWTVTAKASELTGGIVHTAKAPATFCAA